MPQFEDKKSKFKEAKGISLEYIVGIAQPELEPQSCDPNALPMISPPPPHEIGSWDLWLLHPFQAVGCVSLLKPAAKYPEAG